MRGDLPSVRFFRQYSASDNEELVADQNMMLDAIFGSENGVVQ